jgi:predicted dehydrogenase
MTNKDNNIKNDKIGIVLVGCGYWGVNYVRVFNELPNAYIAVVCDQREERLRDIQKRFPSVRVTTDLQDALSNYDAHAAVVCTGATTHHALVKQCLLAGKHVMVEKPMTTCTACGEELVEVAETKGLTLMVGHTFLYNNAVRTVKNCLKDIGQVYYLYARRTNLGPIRQDVNALWDLAPHDVSIFNYWMDASPDWVSAVGSQVLQNGNTPHQAGHEDVGFVSLGYPGGVIAHIHVSWADPHKVREMVVVGSRERIVFNDLNPLEAVRVFEKGVSVQAEASNYGEHQLMMRDGDIISPHIEPGEPLRTECAHYIECVTTGCKPMTGSKEGLAVVRVMEAIDKSMAAKGAPVMVSQ